MKINALNTLMLFIIFLSTVVAPMRLVAQDGTSNPPETKPELSVQPLDSAAKEAPAEQVAPVVNEPSQVNPHAQSPLDSVAQGLSASPTPLPVKAIEPSATKTSSAASSGADSATHSPKKPPALKPMGPSIKNVQGEKLAQATGHFARARSLLIASLVEFDKGLELANPDALFSSSEWRASVTARAREIEHILAPQPRETTGGIKFQADPRLLGEAKR